MMKTILLVLCVFVASAVAKDIKCNADGMAYPPVLKPLPSGEAKNVTTFVVNLDEDPATRWNKVVVPLKIQILNLTLVIEDTLRKLVGNKVVDKVLSVIEADLPGFYARLPHDFGQEIAGIAKATDIDAPVIFVYNIFYTIFGACTSMVTQNDAGDIFHTRNLDFGLWPDFDLKNRQVWELTAAMRPLVANIDFQRGGKTLFKSTTFAGFIGAHTAMKPGAFSLSIDTRFDSNVDLGLIKWIEEKKLDHDLEVTMMTRAVFQDETTYEAAFAKINNTKVIGPAYIIFSGINAGQGAVITKGKPATKSGKDGETIDVWLLGDEIKQNNTFFLVETNYDRTGPAPSGDDRRDPAIKCLDELTPKGYDFKGTYNVLSAIPNLNRLTLFTTLMHAKEGAFEAYRQYCQGLDCPLV
jgi:acid ceramidase